MPAIDYRGLYDEYWARPDRFGSHSFDDAATLASQMLSVCGPGSILDVGAGMGLLVHTLLGMGIDAHGVDVSSVAVKAANTAAPDRFSAGSILDLPFGENSFDTAVTTDVLEHIAEDDVPKALAELARVARRSVFVRLATTPDRDGTWHLTVRDRAWWEQRLFEAGLRKHPLTQFVLPYTSAERESSQITIVLEKIPADAAQRWPVRALAQHRQLHMDMLRESGRRSDAHLARYTLACKYVRPGDVVLDAACGLGYGSAILAAGTPAASVLGVDIDPQAVEYAHANFIADERLSFRAQDLADLSSIADRSVDLVACFETLEHVHDPERLLAEFARVLTPGGRLIASVPNDWTDETGNDPNPHHLHVYTWDTLAQQVSRSFIIEKAYAQVAGGGMKLSDRPRSLDDVRLDRRPPVPALAPPKPADPPAEKRTPDAEWWLVVGMKSPIAADKSGYRESAFADYREIEGFHVADFAREYDNPWLVRSMVSIGMRATDPAVLELLAEQTLARCRHGSPDEGAALCVLAYQRLAAPASTTDSADTLADDLLPRLAAYQRCADDSPHAWRWRISNEYVLARLLLKAGRRVEAEASFRRCAAMDCTRFSPLLANKTVDAFFQAGMIRLADADAKGASECWTLGLEECRRVLQGSWTNIWGRAAQPVTFGMPEVAQLADVASRCSFGLDMLQRLGTNAGPASGRVWHAAQTQTLADSRRWAEQLARANSWLAGQINHGSQSNGLMSHVGALLEAKAWAEQQVSNWRDTVTQRDETITQLLQGKAWLEDQRASWISHAATQDATIAELRKWNEDLAEAKRWVEGNVANFAQSLANSERTIAELQSWNQQLVEAKRWSEEHAATLESELAKSASVIAELRGWTNKLTEGARWFQAQSAAWKQHDEDQQSTINELREWTEKLIEGRTWLEGQLALTQDELRKSEQNYYAIRADNEQLRAAYTALERQAAALRARHESAEKSVLELKAWNTQLEQARDWLDKERTLWINRAQASERSTAESNAHPKDHDE